MNLPGPSFVTSDRAFEDRHPHVRRRWRVSGLWRYAGPGLLVSVGYMDPGNWATGIEAGSRYGFALLFVVVASGLAAMLLQWLSMRLGVVTGKSLAHLTRERYGAASAWILWPIAEIAIIATDVAEVLGSALALKLLFGLPLWIGVLVTACDTLFVLALVARGVWKVETIILGLVAIITTCFAIQLCLLRPDIGGIVHGLLPSAILVDPEALYIATGIVGATVMPHNLYLHSAIVPSRSGSGSDAKRRAIRFATIDILVSLTLATVVNGAIVALAATVFHASSHAITGLADAYQLLTPMTGAALASVLFGVALLASGQSATFTGTIASQVLLEGFTDLKIPAWQRRAITRALALLPALAGVVIGGDHSIGMLLVLTQVILAAGLPFTVFPLIRLTSDARIMGDHATRRVPRCIAWLLLAAITMADIWLVVGFLT
ncbi:MAG TPA: Nramp family divalent metal transporter [Sphingomonadaceae bacterium]|nr:Nramp family divalent metal transporter [Sphingomonadaceae bacterium]